MSGRTKTPPKNTVVADAMLQLAESRIAYQIIILGRILPAWLLQESASHHKMQAVRFQPSGTLCNQRAQNKAL